MTNPRGYTTTFTYDKLNRRTTTTDALNQLATVVYDAAGNATVRMDPRASTTIATYDKLNRVETQTDALTHKSSYVYDAAGNRTVMVDPLGYRTTVGYDALNRQQTVTDPGGGVATTAYDAAGNVSGRTDQAGNGTAYGFDVLNRQIVVIDALGGRATVVLDAAGNQTVVIDQVGNRTTSAYDALNRVTEEQDPLGVSGTFAYDVVSRRTSQTDRLGQRRDFEYDAAGRNTRETWVNSGGSTANTISYTLDGNGNRTVVRDGNGAYTYAYDALDRMTVQNAPFGVTLTYTLDQVGNRTQVQDSFGGYVTASYNAANQLMSRKSSSGAAARVDQAYDGRNALTTITRYSDVSGATKIGDTQLTYDAVGRPTNIKHRDGTGTSLLNLTYTYDVAGRVTTEVTDGTTKTYAYDAINQLTNDGSAYTFDGAGNRTMTGYSTGAGNRMTTGAAYTYTHDANGNWTKKTKGASAGAIKGNKRGLTPYKYNNCIQYRVLRHLCDAVLAQPVVGPFHRDPSAGAATRSLKNALVASTAARDTRIHNLFVAL